MVLALEVVDRETRGHRLHVQRLRSGRRVRLAGVLARLEPGDVLGAAQRQQLAGLGGVDNEVGPDDALHPGDTIAQSHGLHTVPVAERNLRHVLEQHPEAIRGSMRRQHRLEHREPDPRLGRQSAHAARARVELPPRPSRRRQWIVRAVVRADAVTQPAVARGDAEVLRPGVLVEWHGLTCELSAEPASLLCHDDLGIGLRRRERRRDAAQPTPDDKHLRPLLVHQRDHAG